MEDLASRDFLIFLMVPLMIVTVRQLVINWPSLTDNDLTIRDRNLLKQASMFLVLPAVVFMHEVGHAVAIKMMGGEVTEFHYGILWGYVIPSGTFSSIQFLIIYLAGNAIQVLLGLIFLFIAVVSTSPPVIALATYSALWSIAETIIFYALMSIFGMYGDWAVIYNSTEKEAVLSIGICHFILTAGIFYATYSDTTRLWFARRTDPKWAQAHKYIEARYERQKTAETLLDLGWSFYTAGLDSQARKCARQVLADQPQKIDAYLLMGWVAQSSGHTDEAIRYFKKITESVDSEPLLRTKAFIGMGQAEEDRLYKIPRSKVLNTDRWGNAVWAYTMAAKVSPTLADPVFHRAVLLNKAALYDRAEVDLLSTEELSWLDSSLAGGVDRELGISRRGQAVEK